MDIIHVLPVSKLINFWRPVCSIIRLLILLRNENFFKMKLNFRLVIVIVRDFMDTYNIDCYPTFDDSTIRSICLFWFSYFARPAMVLLFLLKLQFNGCVQQIDILHDCNLSPFMRILSANTKNFNFLQIPTQRWCV